MNFDINMRLVVRGVSYVALGAALFLSGRYIGQNDRLEAVATLQAMTIKSMAPTAVAVADTPAPVAPVQEKDDAPEVKYYDVAEGDMLSLISLETYGSTRYYPYLAKINGLEYPYELQLGETLVLPVDIASMDPTEVEEAYQEAVITESLIALDALTLDEPSEYEVSLKEIVPDNPPSLSPLDSGEFFSPTMTARLP